MDSTTKLWRNCSSPSWAYFGSEYVHGVHSVFPAHGLQSRSDHFLICGFKIAIPTICKKRKGKERKRKEKAKTKCGLLSLCYMGGHPTPSTSTRGATTSDRSHPIQPFSSSSPRPTTNDMIITCDNQHTKTLTKNILCQVRFLSPAFLHLTH